VFLQRLLAVTVGVALGLAGARAGAAPPDDIVADDVVLARGQVEGALTYESNMSLRLVRKPWSLAPDFAVGVTDRLTLGVVHSARGLSLVESGFGFCLAEQGCERGAYDEIGIDSRWALVRRDGLALAARARFVSRSFDPWKPSLRLGALVRFHRGRFAVVADPQLQLGVYHRDLGNRDWLRVPVWLQVQPFCHVMLALRTGIEGELVTFADAFAIPMALELVVRPHPRADAALSYGFPGLLGPQNEYKVRHLSLTVTVRWP
jgi:hypothetical protein